jgi:hypothetical protein
MTGQRIGYKRVSTVDQNTMRQLEGMQLDEVFEDKASGKSTAQRPALEAMLKQVRKGDVVLCHSMDRLARNLDDLRRVVLGLTSRGVRVEFVKEGLNFTGDDSALSKLLLSVMGAFAEFERSLSWNDNGKESRSPKRRACTREEGQLSTLSARTISVGVPLVERTSQGSHASSGLAAKLYTNICIKLTRAPHFGNRKVKAKLEG